VDGSTDFSTVDLRTRFNVPELKHWLPELVGQVSGQLQIKGNWHDPAVQGRLQAKNLAYQSIVADTINADINWQSMESVDNRVTLNATSVQQQDLVGNIDATWQGSFAKHQWQLKALGVNQHADKQLNTRCSGSWQPPAWSTHCDNIDVGFQYFQQAQGWRLSEPVDFALNTETQALSLSAFCLINGEQSLCNPEDIKIDPQNPGTLRLRGRQLSSAADVESDNLALHWLQDDKPPLTVQAQTLALAWQWQVAVQQHRFNWRLITLKNGSSRGEVTLRGEQVDGRLSLTQSQLGAVSRFIITDPKDTIEGEVNAEFSLAGNINNPNVNGTMSIGEGTVRSSALPVPIENIQLKLDVVDNIAKLDGKFTANDSPGNLGGELAWRPDDWYARLTLTAQDLGYRPERNIQVYLSPDVQLHLTPAAIELTGDIRVPRADIEIEQLPEQAATISSDTIIVGNETRSQDQRVKTDLRIQLGDAVKFEGFGLTTDISGNLRLRQNPGELLRGEGVLSLKEGRYQAYGQDLVIRNGDLVFVNDLENPQLRLVAIREPSKTSDDVIVGLRASGPARGPSISLFSEPPLSEQEQMSYLISGVAPNSDKEIDASALAAQQALSYALESNAGESLTSFAGQTLGIRDLRVTSDTNNDGTQIGLSGYLTPNLLVRYGVGMFDSVNSLTLQYQLLKNLDLEAVSGKCTAMDLLGAVEKD